MSGARNDGGPAFPQIEFTAAFPEQGGMSLRDWFAGHAMGALIVANDGHLTSLGVGAAKDAYAAADRMLAVREAFYRTASTEQGR